MHGMEMKYLPQLAGASAQRGLWSFHDMKFAPNNSYLAHRLQRCIYGY